MEKRVLQWTPIIFSGTPPKDMFPSCFIVHCEVKPRVVKFHFVKDICGVWYSSVFTYYNIPFYELMDGDMVMTGYKSIKDVYIMSKNQSIWVACFTTAFIYPSGICFTVSVTTAFTVSGVVGWIKPLHKYVNVLIPGTYQYVTLHGRKLLC